MKTEIAILERKIQQLADKMFLLQNQPEVLVQFKYHEEVILPLQNLLAEAENIEAKIVS